MPTDNQAQQVALAYAERADRQANERWQIVVDELKEEIVRLKETVKILEQFETVEHFNNRNNIS